MLKFKFAKYLFFLGCFLNSIQCTIEKHFKKITDKADIHTMRNIDFIYVINLDERPEKWQRTYEQLAPYGIIPYRFSAVNGWKLSLETLNKVGLKFKPHMKAKTPVGLMGTSYKLDGNFQPHHEIITQYNQTYFAHSMSRGAIGIVLSHLSILQDAFDAGYKTIWVMEDDIEVAADPREISHLIDKLDTLVGKENWDILFTDKDTRSNNGEYVPAAGMAPRPNFTPKSTDQYYVRKEVSEDFIQIGARFGAYSMIIRRSGIEKILNFIKAHKIFLPYDLDYYLPEGIKIYTTKNGIVRSLLNAPSDNGAPYYSLNKTA